MIRGFYFFAFLLFASSCITQKDVLYLQNTRTGDFATAAAPPYYLKTNDVLSVRVISPSPEISNIFNTMPMGMAGGGGGGGFMNADPGNLFLQGYSLDENGEISMPTIGKVMVRNMTVDQAQQVIQQRINEYVKNSTVLVRMVSFRITVLGEVRTPGHFYIFNRQATLFDGLGMAGDINPFGNRKSVNLVRQTQEGSEIIKLDLRDPKLLQSKYYYLSPNDAIYVEPLGAQTARNNFVLIGTVSAVLTTAILLFRFISEF
jgi:polysaccharide biosynthesis/export protein